MVRGRRELPRVGDGDWEMDPGSFPFQYMGLGYCPGWGLGDSRTGDEQALGAPRGSQQPDGDLAPLPRGIHGGPGGLGCCLCPLRWPQGLGGSSVSFQTATSSWPTLRVAVVSPLSTALMASATSPALPAPRSCRRTAAAASSAGLRPASPSCRASRRRWTAGRSTRLRSASTRRVVSGMSLATAPAGIWPCHGLTALGGSC